MLEAGLVGFFTLAGIAVGSWLESRRRREQFDRQEQSRWVERRLDIYTEAIVAAGRAFDLAQVHAASELPVSDREPSQREVLDGLEVAYESLARAALIANRETQRYLRFMRHALRETATKALLTETADEESTTSLYRIARVMVQAAIREEFSVEREAIEHAQGDLSEPETRQLEEAIDELLTDSG